MRLGILLPTFRRSPHEAIAMAKRAAAAGLDGVFAYDHLWPMGSPERPALAPVEVLAAVATTVPSLVVGTLVARVGLVADAVLLAQLRALSVVANGRVIAGLGTGDRLSAAENLAYGVAVAPDAERRASLRAIAEVLVRDGVEVWVGDGAPPTRAVAREVGCTLNLWQATPEEAERQATDGPVSWAGAAPTHDGAIDEAATATLLGRLDGAGATWAVCSPATAPEDLVRLAAAPRPDRGVR